MSLGLIFQIIQILWQQQQRHSILSVSYICQDSNRCSAHFVERERGAWCVCVSVRLSTRERERVCMWVGGCRYTLQCERMDLPSCLVLWECSHQSSCVYVHLGTWMLQSTWRVCRWVFCVYLLMNVWMYRYEILMSCWPNDALHGPWPSCLQ